MNMQMQISDIELDEYDQALVEAIQCGLPLVSRPYAEVGASLGMSESEVIDCLKKLINQGVIKRMGVIVRHRELGYHANGMVVWDVPDDQISELGKCIGQFEFVTLCYRRPRRLPEWNYNLFCMIHGCDRETVLRNKDILIERCNLQGISHDVLFSQRRFKQRGAQYRNVS